jgi:hypothetical protein
MTMKLLFVLQTRMVVVKEPRKLHDDVFFYIEGGHLLKVNWLTQTLVTIDHKASKAI